ncbi:PREDICTED: zinc finger protein 777-like, partial [Cariama cristata]|uniref:zinc finger protein 777-like n=1 Tax=Cariama cristata TaxID=54380 RepID=UPI00052036AD
VPVTFDDISVYFNEQEWERLDRWQKDLYRAVMRGNYETLISLADYAVSKPDILSRIERDEELCIKVSQEPPRAHIRGGEEPPQACTKDQEPQQVPEEMDQVEEALGEGEVPMEGDTGYAASEPDALSRIKRDEELCVKGGQKPAQACAEDGQKSPQAGVPDSQKPPRTCTGDAQKPPQTGVPDGPKPSQTEVPDSQKPPRTCTGDGQKPSQTGVLDGQKSPQTCTGDGQKPLQTGVPHGQKPRHELPILVMNVMSLSAQKQELRREDQPETEMDEDPAESNTEEGFLMENEMVCEGASPEDVKLKEEEPEALQELSAPSPGPEIQKCPKSEQAKAKSKKKPSRCESSSLLMGNCRRGYVREWSHPCTECGKRFRLKINLIIHQRSHAKEGPYECTMCEISFADKRHLDLHQSIHIKDRAFGAKVWGNVHPELRIRPRRKFCGTFCGSAHSLGNGTYSGGPCLGQAKEELVRGSLPSACFSRQQSPKSRSKSVLKCSLCKKNLSCTFSLQRHLQIHARDRPYCCAACKKCFTRRTHLLRHEKIHDRQKALAALQQPATVVPAPQQPEPQRAPEVPTGGRVPRSPAQASERNISPAASAAKAVSPNALL